VRGERRQREQTENFSHAILPKEMARF
jgi:hypothetical protein